MADPSKTNDGLVLVGRIAGLYGVRGWLKVYSYTREREDILRYTPWLIDTGGGWKEVAVVDGRMQGPGVVAQLAGYADREAAGALIGSDIAIRVEQLPPLKPGEYYWAQLEGLKVVNLQGIELGQVVRLFETGANDVMVVAGERERLIPYIGDVIKEVDVGSGLIRVDWDADF